MTRSLLAALLLVGCLGGAAQERVHGALDAMTDAADPAYEATVMLCLAAEGAALAGSTSRDEWEPKKVEIREVCDEANSAWERAREAQEKAREAVDACVEAQDAGCVSGALEAARAAQAAVGQATDAWDRAQPVLQKYAGSRP